jgi:hypothetical protein
MEAHGVEFRRSSGSLTIASGQNGIDGLRDLLAWNWSVAPERTGMAA